MKKILSILVVLIYIFQNAIIAKAEEKENINYNITRESVEILTTLGVFGGSLLVDKTPVWFENPLIGGQTNLPFKPDTVPSSVFYISSPLAISGIYLLPNNQGWINDTSYVNSKGFAQAFFLNLLITNITKHLVGRKRPDYDDRIAKGIDLDEARLSFFSGHSSAAFVTSSYLSLYTFEHLGNNNNPLHLTGKILTSLALLSTSSWIVYTRVNDHKHNISDVVVGALVGSGIAFLVYSIQNEWFFKIYDRKEKNDLGSLISVQSISSTPKIINYNIKF